MKTSARLGHIITETLSPLICSDYIFLDIPYYTNIGDTLIYKGTLDFLATLQGKCLYKTAIENYVKPTISENIIILFQGGGNFGDIWRRHTKFILQVLKEFPCNKAIILPQTIYYQNKTLCEVDARQMAQHKNLTICARDKETYRLAITQFSSNNILMLPDMAFCIATTFLNKYIKRANKGMLFFKRKDKEYAAYDYDRFLDSSVSFDELEWPSMDRNLFISRYLSRLKRFNALGYKIGIGGFTRRLLDWYAQGFYMPQLLKLGIQFISQYQQIYSTRLHGAILSILMDKSTVFFDNIYGKNSSFYDTWLTEVENVKFIHRDF